MSDIELVWLLLRLVAFAAGLLAGVLLVYAWVWQPLARARKEELDWQAKYAALPRPMVASEPARLSASVWLTALWLALRSRKRVDHDR